MVYPEVVLNDIKDEEKPVAIAILKRVQSLLQDESEEFICYALQHIEDDVETSGEVSVCQILQDAVDESLGACTTLSDWLWRNKRMNVGADASKHRIKWVDEMIKQLGGE